MKKKSLFLIVIIALVIFYSCNDKKEKKQTILVGQATILVDETLLQIVQDQVDVFENQYDAKITLVPKSESEIVQMLVQNKQQLAILTRELTKVEAQGFENKNIKPRVTPFATDAIAFIVHKSNKDTLVSVEDIVNFVQGKKQNKCKGLVFDNPNSSTVRYIKEVAKLKDLPKENIFSFKTNNEVIQFISKNEGMIGVVGVNWLYQPNPDMMEVVKAVNVLGVKSLNGNNYIKPNQDNMASGNYPLTREIKMLNYQGFKGLGMGFASFMAGDIGQRIVLKSGLVPVKMPNRNITIQKEIKNK
ncbi:substrate-binding domain-containing protein [Flavobacterium sp.]|uniref:PstS family phosphate ABC transporter substrate-binding protein n=1 Tax=Flavobacterium sp. TaxID=239 RepID=UPI00286E5537|nr:substrate-binding domain-containing protein [Flavobacterium sp.]